MPLHINHQCRRVLDCTENKLPIDNRFISDKTAGDRTHELTTYNRKYTMTAQIQLDSFTTRILIITNISRENNYLVQRPTYNNYQIKLVCEIEIIKVKLFF